MNHSPPPEALTFLVVYNSAVFWSMGEGRGTPSFLRTVEALVGHGHEVHVCLPGQVDGSPGPDGSEATSVEMYHGCQLHRSNPPGRIIPRVALPLPLRMWERWRCWRRYQKWARATALEVGRQQRPDLVVGMGDYEAPVASAVARELGVPNVTRLFGVYGRSGLHYWANFPGRASLRTPAAALLITNDGSPGDRLARRAGFPEDRTFFIRNGIVFDQFHPGPPSPAVRERLAVRPDQPLLMTVSRLSSEKRIYRALHAFVEVHAQRPEAVLALVGDGEERPALEALAEELGLAHCVRFPGAILQRDLPDWYRTADLVLSLLDRTNTANPCFEAMASGAVYVALETVTTRDLITDQVNGIVVPRAELSTLGARLVDLLDQEDLRRQIGAAAAAEIQKRLVTPEERLAFEVDLYEAIAHGRPWPDRRLG